MVVSLTDLNNLNKLYKLKKIINLLDLLVDRRYIEVLHALEKNKELSSREIMLKTRLKIHTVNKYLDEMHKFKLVRKIKSKYSLRKSKLEKINKILKPLIEEI